MADMELGVITVVCKEETTEVFRMTLVAASKGSTKEMVLSRLDKVTKEDGISVLRLTTFRVGEYPICRCNLTFKEAYHLAFREARRQTSKVGSNGMVFSGNQQGQFQAGGGFAPQNPGGFIQGGSNGAFNNNNRVVGGAPPIQQSEIRGTGAFGGNLFNGSHATGLGNGSDGFGNSFNPGFGGFRQRGRGRDRGRGRFNNTGRETQQYNSAVGGVGQQVAGAAA